MFKYFSIRLVTYFGGYKYIDAATLTISLIIRSVHVHYTHHESKSRFFFFYLTSGRDAVCSFFIFFPRTSVRYHYGLCLWARIFFFFFLKEFLFTCILVYFSLCSCPRFLLAVGCWRWFKFEKCIFQFIYWL